MSIAKKGDFLIVEATKRCLIKVKDVDGKTITGLSQHMKRTADGKYEKRPTLTVKARDVIVNLGQAPLPGKVYGVNIEPLYKKVDTNTCGQILFFVDMDDAHTKKTKNALIRVFKKMKKKRLGGVPCEIEIRRPEGKYSGWYHFLPKAENDVLCIKPNFDMMTPADMEYVIAHEYAHGVWFRMLRQENIAAWIELYDQHMALASASEEDLKEILEEAMGEGGIRQYMKSCDDDTLPIVKACLRQIRSLHGVDRKHLDLLVRSGRSIEEYWPTYVEFSDKNVIVSEYAQKSPEEFFAEAFAFWFTGKSIPKEVRRLLERSLSQLVRGRINTEEEEESTRGHDRDDD